MFIVLSIQRASQPPDLHLYNTIDDANAAANEFRNEGISAVYIYTSPEGDVGECNPFYFSLP